MTKSNIRIDQLKDKEASYLQVECPYRTCPFQCKFCCSAFEGSYPFNDTSLYLENRWAYFQTLGDVIKEYNVEEIIVSGMTEPSLSPEYVDDMAMFCRRNGITSVIQTMDHSKGYGNYDVVAYSIRDAAQMDKVPVSDAATTRYTIVLSNEIKDADLLRFIWRTKSAAEHLGTEWQMTIKYLAYTSNGHKEVDEYIKNNRRTLDKPMLKIMKENGVWVDDDCMNSKGTKPTYVFRQDGNLYDKWTSERPLDEIPTEQEEMLEEMWAAKVVADYEGDAEKEIFTFAEALEELGFTKDDLKEALKNL